MATHRESMHGQWSSRWAFILAATGSAVGLGNIWKFPYMAGENGGGAFVLVYLLCVALIGIPIMMAEVLIGRHGRRSPTNTLMEICKEQHHSQWWQLIGWSGMLVGFLILSYYSVIAGWTLAYVFRAGSGTFTALGGDAVGKIFSDFISDPERLLAWHTIFMGLTMVVVARGVKSGLETAVTYLMPALFVLLLILVGYAMNTGYFTEGLSFLFKPDFSKISANGVLAAMGQAFFSLSIGMGAIMIYGSYLPQDASITRSSIIIALADTLVAILAGVAIFPIVFANGLDPAQSVGLVFNTLPIAFGNMPGGAFFGMLFFILLAFAAWTSAISLIEPMVTWLVESLGMNRVTAVVWTGACAWLLGIGTIFSFNLWSDYTINKMSFFDVLDYLTSNVLLPLGGILITIFAVWIMSEKSTREELSISHEQGYSIWRFVLRYITPVAMFFVLLKVAGIIGS